jgi:hypothetical protein
MKKLLIVWLATAFLGILLTAEGFHQSWNWMGIPNLLSIDRVTFLVFLSAVVGVVRFSSRPKKWIGPLVATLFGSTWVGPIATLCVGSVLVLDRVSESKNPWHRLKDLFSLAILVVACGLPEAERSILLFIAALAISIDFGASSVGILPAILFYRTLGGMTIPLEGVMVLMWIITVAHILWYWKFSDSENNPVWVNAISLLIILSSVSLPMAQSLPIMLSAAMISEVIRHQKKEWVISGAVLLTGLPFFVGSNLNALLLERHMLWALPAFPFLILLTTYRYATSVNETSNTESRYPIWAIIVSFIFVMNVIWSNSFVSFGGLSELMFQASNQTNHQLDDETIGLIFGLVLLGILSGWLVGKFLPNQHNPDGFNSTLQLLGRRFHSVLVRMGLWIDSQLFWQNERDVLVKFDMSVFLFRLFLSIAALLGLAWLYRMIALGELW